MDLSPVLAKAAANVGDTARLTCRAKGAPDIQFKWSREGTSIPANTTKKYSINYLKVFIFPTCLFVFESRQMVDLNYYFVPG